MVAGLRSPRYVTRTLYGSAKLADDGLAELVMEFPIVDHTGRTDPG
jgi:hypothetical protein